MSRGRRTARSHWCMAGFAAASVVMPLAGCGRSGDAPATGAAGGCRSDNAGLFTIPPEQMAHVQLVTVQPDDIDAKPAVDRDGRLQQFSYHAGHHAGERPGGAGGSCARAESAKGRADAPRSMSGIAAGGTFRALGRARNGPSPS